MYLRRGFYILFLKHAHCIEFWNNYKFFPCKIDNSYIYPLTIKTDWIGLGLYFIFIILIP